MLSITPAHEISLDEQAQVLTEAFAGYIGGSFTMDAAGLSTFLCAQGIDLCFSRFARNGTDLCGFGYIGRTGEISRLSGMGVVAAARRTGVARSLVRHLLEEARQRGDRVLMLEVIEQNPPAYALYESEGFRSLTRLCGWRRPPGALHGTDPAAPEEISLAVASQLPAPQEFPDLPWQISRHAIAKMSSARAFTSGGAVTVISDPSIDGPIRIHAFSSREGLAAIVQHYSTREFVARPLFPEAFGDEIFGPLGFAKEPLSQWLMRFDL